MSRIDYFVGKGSEIMGKAKAFSMGVLVGSILVVGSYFIYHSVKETKKIDTSNITVKQISGSEIKHSGYTDAGSSYKFTTTAAGPGEIITTVPKDVIPEARSWIRKTKGISIVGGYSIRETYSIESMYWRRFDSISFGAGCDAEISSQGKADIGIKVGLMYWFE